MRRDDALDQRRHARAVEDVELARVLLEDAREGELFDGAAPVRGRVKRDVRRRGVVVVDAQEAVLACVRVRRAEAEEDLEEVRGWFWRRLHGDVVGVGTPWVYFGGRWWLVVWCCFSAG